MGKVFILCNPLMDTIIPASYPQIKEWGITPGSMNLVEYTLIEKIRSEATALKVTPGGSGANTARGIAWLAEKLKRPITVYYLGAVGLDADGERLTQLFTDSGVKPILPKKDGFKTGMSLVLVTPDYERTMCTFLGACRELKVQDMPLSVLEEANVLYITGYNWDTPNQRDTMRQAVEIVKLKKGKVMFDLSDPFLVNRYKDLLLRWIPGQLDLLVGNREEIKILTDSSRDREGLLKAQDLAPTVIMKTGKEGCLIAVDENIFEIPGKPANVKDTTGAGDSFAAGYIFSYLEGRKPLDCGTLANRLASQIVSVYGCDYSQIESSEVM